MDKAGIVFCWLMFAAPVGCMAQDGPPQTDDQMVSDAFASWEDTYGMPSRCADELPDLRIVDSAERCPTSDACFAYNGVHPTIYLAPVGYSAGERARVIVHEMTHWILWCSGARDHDHAHPTAWEWAEQTADAVAY